MIQIVGLQIRRRKKDNKIASLTKRLLAANKSKPIIKLSQPEEDQVKERQFSPEVASKMSD